MWFVEMPERTWSRIAGGASLSGQAWQRGTDFRSVIPGSPGDHIAALPTSSSNVEGPEVGVFGQWNGACVDQDRREMIFAANGGHGAYPGNEVYLLRLGNDAPGYSRLTDPTPAQYLRGDVVAPGPASYDDFVAPAVRGRMRAVHGYNRACFANGKVWYAAQDGYSNTSGSQTPSSWCFDRDLVESIGEFPLRHRVDQSPWTYLGSPNLPGAEMSTERFARHPSIYDPVSQRVYSFSRFAHSSGGHRAWYIDAGTGQIVDFAITLPGTAYGEGWGVCIPDAPERGQSLFVFAEMESSAITIWNLASGEIIRRTPTNAASTYWTDPSNTSSPPADSVRHAPGHGAVYHAASRSILVYSPRARIVDASHQGLGSTLRRLRLPANPLRDSYTWEDVAAASGSEAPAYSPNGCYSKFNIVHDMGNGQACLVLAADSNAAYVYKLPAGDF